VAKYGNFVYGGATYGETRKLAYSVDPMDVVVLSFSTAYVTWYSPSGNFSRIRLVRNQVGFPETAEDGVVIWEEYATQGTVSRSSFIDGVDNPNSIAIVAGRPIYYSMFLFTDEKVWINAGKISDIVPGNHSSQKRFMDLIPKVYTSAIQSPLGVTDDSSALYRFIDGMSFTYEQFITELDLLRPVHSSDISSYLLLPIETANVGLDQEPNIPIKNQKRLIREAFYMYSRKGLKTGVETYVESLSGYAPTVTVSPNLLLTPQDSTFYNGLGNWVFGNATATASSEQVPASGDSVIDNVYSCKLVAPSNPFSMILGEDDPIRKGIPVNAGVEYTVSCKVKSPSSAGNVYLSIAWFDGTGTFIDSTSPVNTSANNTWKSISQTATAPANAVYAGLDLSSSATGTYYVDQVCMQLGNTAVYDEARAITVFLSPTKTNLIKNPSFEVNVTDGWTTSGATITQDVDVSDLVYSGSKSAKIVATGNWTLTSNTFPVVVGKYYTASGLAKTTSDLTATFIARDSLGNIVESVDVYPLGTMTNWMRFQVTDLINAYAETAVTYEIVFSGGAGTFYLDCVQFESGISASEYFDGSLPSQFGTVWEGTANNSFTHLYTNKPFKVPRVGLTINDWLPPNTMWRVNTYAGVEYTNLTV
jgi:hypothetical protein